MALVNNFPINEIEIERTSNEQREQKFGLYTIRLWFRYSKNYYKGFGFFVDFIDNRWVIRNIPDTSTKIVG